MLLIRVDSFEIIFSYLTSVRPEVLLSNILTAVTIVDNASAIDWESMSLFLPISLAAALNLSILLTLTSSCITDSFLSVFTMMGLFPVPGRSASGSALLLRRAEDARSFLSIECALSRGIHLGLPSPGSRAQSPLISPSVPTRTQSPFLPLPNHFRRSSTRSRGSRRL